MRIEVIIGNEEPVVYPLNNPKISLGTSENCEVILNAEGISRKHVTILTEGDNFYVIDQGSTNGSFINEERLIPGRKTEFTSFFPVRLGDNVLVTLIGDDEGNGRLMEMPASFKEKKESSITPAPKKESTGSLTSLNNLKKSDNTQKGTSTKITTNKKTSPKPPPPKKKSNAVPMLAFLILAGAAVYNIFFMKEEAPEPPPVKVGRIVKVPVKETPAEKSLLLSKDEIIPKEALQSSLHELKCSTDIEKELCEIFPGANENPFGVVQVGLKIYILVDGTKYFDEVKDYLPKILAEPSPEFLKSREEIQSEAGGYQYLVALKNKIIELEKAASEKPASETSQDATTTQTENKPKPVFDLTKYQDMKFAIALFLKKEDGEFEIRKVLAFKPEVLPLIKSEIPEGLLFYVRQNGTSALLPIKNLFQSY